MGVKGVGVPAGAHDIPSRPGHPDGSEIRRRAALAFRSHIVEVLPPGIIGVSFLQHFPGVSPAGVIQAGHASVRHADVEIVVVSALQSGHEGFRQGIVIHFRHIVNSQDVVERHAVITRGELHLGAVRVDLDLLFFVQSLARIAAPFLGFLEFGEEDADVEQSVHLHREPVVPLGIGAQMQAVLMERLDHHDDGVVVEGGGVQEIIERRRPGVQGADAGLDRPPAGPVDIGRIVGQGIGAHPAAHLADEGLGVFLVPGGLVGLSQRDPEGTTAELVGPFDVFEGGRVDGPVDRVAELVGDAAAREQVGGDLVGRAPVVIRDPVGWIADVAPVEDPPRMFSGLQVFHIVFLGGFIVLGGDIFLDGLQARVIQVDGVEQHGIVRHRTFEDGIGQLQEGPLDVEILAGERKQGRDLRLVSGLVVSAAHHQDGHQGAGIPVSGDLLLRPGLLPVQEGEIPFDRLPDRGALRGLVHPEVLADLLAGQRQLHEAQQVHAAIAPGLGPGHLEGLLSVRGQLAVETPARDFPEAVLGEVALSGVDGISSDLEVVVGAVVVV